MLRLCHAVYHTIDTESVLKLKSEWKCTILQFSNTILHIFANKLYNNHDNFVHVASSYGVINTDNYYGNHIPILVGVRMELFKF